MRSGRDENPSIAAAASRGVAVLLVAAALALSLEAIVEALSCRPALLPNGGINNCSNCHVNIGGGGPRNAFGQDVDRFSIGCEEFWEPELAFLDSDGDGRTNGEELGDPAGIWRPGDPDPGDPAFVTNPGVPDRPRPRPFVRADSNADGRVDLSDAVGTLEFLFLEAPRPPCREASDANGDGSLDIADAVFTLLFIFGGGAAPPAPFPECGKTSAAADCESFLPCG